LVRKGRDFAECAAKREAARENWHDGDAYSPSVPEVPVPTPLEASRIPAQIATHLPHLTRPQQRGLADWVRGVLLAGTGCQPRVATALAAATHAPVATVQQRLREWLRDGADKACPGAAQIELAPCFAALLRWIVAWWPPTEPLPLALDATLHHDQLAAIVLSVCYRGTALPIAWAIGPANRRTFGWKEPTQQLFAALQGVVSAERLVLVTADRGFWSPALWETVCALGWHPLFRVRPDATFCPTGGQRVRAQTLVQPGEAWCGEGLLYRHRATRRAVTLVAGWAADAREPWLLATDLPPDAVTPAWYRVRMGIEASFACLKSRGWEWERTRRRAPERVARHWLVLAIALLLSVAVGTWQDAADSMSLPRPATRARSLFQQGRAWLQRQLIRQRALPLRLSLTPEPWPTDVPGVVATAADPAP